MSKTIFAIGANSTLARAVLPLLARSNHIITAGRSECDVYCDINEEVTIPSGVDVVINFAASFGGSSDDEIMGAVQTNVLGMLRICEAANKASVAHVIAISSIFAALPKDDPQYSIYALTKRHADELVTFYAERNNLPLTILRLSRVYGDTDAFSKGQPFLYKLLDTVRQGKDITLYGNNDALRNYIHTLDLAEILTRIVDARVTGVYACTHPSDTTYSQIATIAQKLFNNGGSIIYLKDKPDVPSDIIIHNPLLYEKIKYRPAISMEAGVERIKHHLEG